MGLKDWRRKNIICPHLGFSIFEKIIKILSLEPTELGMNSFNVGYNPSSTT